MAVVGAWALLAAGNSIWATAVLDVSTATWVSLILLLPIFVVGVVCLSGIAWHTPEDNWIPSASMLRVWVSGLSRMVSAGFGLLLGALVGAAVGVGLASTSLETRNATFQLIGLAATFWVDVAVLAWTVRAAVSMWRLGAGDRKLAARKWLARGDRERKGAVSFVAEMANPIVTVVVGGTVVIILTWLAVEAVSSVRRL